jgi:hypothetical protein
MLVAALPSLDEPGLPIAEVWRRVCAVAEENGCTRPSYEQVRRLVHRERAIRALPAVGDPIVEGWLRARSPQGAFDEAVRRHRERSAARAAVEAERGWRPTTEDRGTS